MTATSAGLAARPFEATITPRVCDCGQNGMHIGTYRSLFGAIRILSGYWNVYLGFFGDQMVWLDFTIVDRRDGVIVWRNGHEQKGGKNGSEGK